MATSTASAPSGTHRGWTSRSSSSVERVLSRGSVVCIYVRRPTSPTYHKIHIPIAIYIAQSAGTISEPQADTRAKGENLRTRRN